MKPLFWALHQPSFSCALMHCYIGPLRYQSVQCSKSLSWALKLTGCVRHRILSHCILYSSYY